MGVILAMVIQRVLGLPEGDVEPWRQALAFPLAILVTFAVGFVLGLINGITVVKSRAASFIITLGFLSVYHGVALVTSGGASYMLFGRFEWLGRGRIMNFIPISILFLLGIAVISYLVLRYFRYGRFLYAIGGNRQAAYVSGININRVIITGYILVGILNALAALILISRVGSALATTGDDYALNSLAAVIVGGVSITGGRGTALNIFLGVVLIGLIGNALIIMNVNPYVRDIVIGLVIITAVTISQYTSARE
jgi:ribose/xylose/arabinose/galactoside ABC-type transport system permease subunit